MLINTLEASPHIDEFQITFYSSVDKLINRVKKGEVPIPVLTFLEKTVAGKDKPYHRLDKILALDDKKIIKVFGVSYDDTPSGRAEAYVAGACDFISKPIEEVEFQFKINTQLALIAKAGGAKSGADDKDEKIKDLTTLIHLMDATLKSRTVKELCYSIIETCYEFDLKAGVQAFPNKNYELFYFTDGHESRLKGILEDADQSKRLVSIQNMLVVNHENIRLLVTPIPTDNAVKGRLLDHISVIARAADNHLAALYTAFNSMVRRKKLEDIAMFSQFTIDEVKKNYQLTANLGSETINQLMDEMYYAFTILDLDERQETMISNIVEEKTKQLLEQNDKAFELIAIFEELRDTLKSLT